MNFKYIFGWHCLAEWERKSSLPNAVCRGSFLLSGNPTLHTKQGGSTNLFLTSSQAPTTVTTFLSGIKSISFIFLNKSVLLLPFGTTPNASHAYTVIFFFPELRFFCTLSTHKSTNEIVLALKRHFRKAAMIPSPVWEQVQLSLGGFWEGTRKR